MKSMKVRIGLLIMLALVVTTSTFAFWASSVSGPSSEDATGTITVGSGNAVTTSFTLTGSPETGGDLVPANQAANSGVGAVESVPLNYTLQWTEDAATSQLAGTSSVADLDVAIVVALVDSGANSVTDTDVLNLITVTQTTVPAQLTLGAAAENLTFTVTMGEPANQADYALIAGGTITVTITFSLSNIVTTDS